MSYVKTFESSSLTKEEYQYALGYLCIERNYYYIFTKHYNLKTFPLFYLDRFIGWKYAGGSQPLLSVYDGLGEMLDKYVRREEMFSLENFKTVLLNLFQDEKKMLVNFWTKNKIGTPFVTSLMLEGMDEGDTVFFTKINEDNNAICSPMKYSELIENIDIEIPNEIELTIINKAPMIRELANMNPYNAFQFIFKEIYGYSIINGDLYKGNEKISLKTDGVKELINYFRGAYTELVQDGAISKPNQFKLNKHIHNRFQPIQYYLGYLLKTNELSTKMSSSLKKQIQIEIDNMEKALNTVLKFASLFVIKPTTANFDLYLNALNRLQNIIPSYQNVQLDIIKELVTE
ncbi:hypothetical protein [Bacillus toyonensis]|uniref:hypothetical protein n=1 Tax=Bacillus toyonensis TaxID=155322 RepID=UPI002175D553|nr:hypothetical protein [Bacillus toyonensis]